MQKTTTRVSLLLLAVAMLLSVTPRRASAQGNAVTVNGVAVSDVMAEMRNGQLMVSVRPFVEALGGNVAWSQADRSATINARGSQIAVWIGNSLAFQNGQRLWAPTVVYMKAEKTMVPGYWLAVRLGASVRYQNGTLIVETGSGSGGSVPSHPLKNASYYFPYLQGARYDAYVDGYGDPRSYQGNGFPHEGIDIMAPKGTPIVAVASGTIIRYGWNTLGGYRLNIQLDDAPNYRFYYAHMDRYAPGIYQGAHVNAGQIIGYVGNTGEGPERTEGHFVTHLHFGIYNADGSSIDPYPFLKFWEQHKARY